MFTDIVGYTALMGKDSPKALEIVKISKDIQKPLVEKHNGKWIKEMGDGAMAQFRTALDAVNCSIEIQKTARGELDAKLRVGIHLGDVTVEEDDVHGDGVNVAARLESIADPGGIYISESIEKAIQGQSNVQAKYLGEIKLKNVAYGVRTYALQGVGLPVPEVQHEKQVSGHFMAELQRRGVVRAGTTFLMFSLLLILLLPYGESMVDLPEWTKTALITALLIGFPLALYLAWNYERSPEGFVRTSSEQSWQNPLAASQRKPLTSNFIIIGLLLVIVVVLIYPRLSLTEVGNREDTEALINDKSIAVLPFENLSNDPEQVYFADGMAEMIRTRLSKLRELKVTSMRSVIQYRDSEKTVPQIAQELGVSYILEGSVFKQGEQVRAVVQLIDPSTDDHIWSESFEGTMLELFDFQSRIAAEVADALRVELFVDSEPEIKSSEVYDLILAANYYMGKLAETSDYEFLLTAEKQFQKAIDLEPQNEYALTGVGWVSYYKSIYGKGKNWFDTAEYYAKKVLDLNQGNSDVNLLLGIVYRNVNQSIKSESFLRRTIELDPNNSRAISWLADLLQNQGKYEESIRMELLSLRLDPNNPERSRNFYSNIGWMMMMVGMDDEAEKSYVAHRELYPGDIASYSGLTHLYLKQGRKEEARAQMNEFNKLININNVDDFNRLDGVAWLNQLVGNYDVARPIYQKQYEKTRKDFQEVENYHHIWRHRYAMILWHDGKIDTAKSLMQEHIALLEKYVEENAGNNPVFDLAGAYAFMGDRENAYKWLEKLPNNIFTNFLMQADPMFDSLRQEDRFKEILQKVNQNRDNMRMTLQNIIASEEMKNMLR